MSIVDAFRSFGRSLSSLGVLFQREEWVREMENILVGREQASRSRESLRAQIETLSLQLDAQRRELEAAQRQNIAGWMANDRVYNHSSTCCLIPGYIPQEIDNLLGFHYAASRSLPVSSTELSSSSEIKKEPKEELQEIYRRVLDLEH